MLHALSSAFSYAGLYCACHDATEIGQKTWIQFLARTPLFRWNTHLKKLQEKTQVIKVAQKACPIACGHARMRVLVREALFIKLMFILRRVHKPHKCPACSSVSHMTIPCLASKVHGLDRLET